MVIDVVVVAAAGVTDAEATDDVAMHDAWHTIANDVDDVAVVADDAAIH